METWTYKHDDGLWHVHCGACHIGCLGGYSNEESALAASEAHDRKGQHQPIGPEW